jgi:hypothetical protein
MNKKQKAFGIIIVVKCIRDFSTDMFVVGFSECFSYELFLCVVFRITHIVMISDEYNGDVTGFICN